MFLRFNQNLKRQAANRLRSQSGNSNRKGLATVEIAFCLVLLIPFILGTLEMCAGYLVKQSLTVSAFEGVRAGVGRGTTNADILIRTAQVLEFRQISLGTASTTEFADADDDFGIFLITRDDLPVEDLDALDPITVRVVAPSGENATPIFNHLVDRKIQASVTMVREFDKPVVNVTVD